MRCSLMMSVWLAALASADNAMLEMEVDGLMEMGGVMDMDLGLDVGDTGGDTSGDTRGDPADRPPVPAAAAHVLSSMPQWSELDGLVAISSSPTDVNRSAFEVTF